LPLHEWVSSRYVRAPLSCTAMTIEIEVLRLLHGAARPDGDAVPEHHALTCERVAADDVGVVLHPADADGLRQRGAKAAFVAPSGEAWCAGLALVVCPDPLLAHDCFRRHLEALGGAIGPGVHSTATLHPLSRVEPGALIGPNCVVHADAVVGTQALLLSGVTVGAGARVECGATLGPHVTIGAGVHVGRNCVIDAGAVIGAVSTSFRPGLTAWMTADGPGALVVEEYARIGPHTVIERGLGDTTRIGRGAFIGGQIYIGHGCDVGGGALVMAQSALGGQSRVGPGATLMGRAVLLPDAEVGDGAVVYGGSAVFGRVEPRAQVFGIPARPRREGLRALVAADGMKKLSRRVKELEKLVETLLGGARTNAG